MPLHKFPFSLNASSPESVRISTSVYATANYPHPQSNAASRTCFEILQYKHKHICTPAHLQLRAIMCYERVNTARMFWYSRYLSISFRRWAVWTARYPLVDSAFNTCRSSSSMGIDHKDLNAHLRQRRPPNNAL